MRWTIAAALSVALLLTTTACQDQQAQSENQRLRAELEELKKDRNNGGNDDLVKLLLAERRGGDSDGLERKLNSFGEDVSAGLSEIRKDISKSEQATNSRMTELESRLDRVSDLESTITSLKGTIEALEGKVKNTDPNEILSVLKEKIQLEAKLDIERKAREGAEATIAELKEELKQAEAERERLSGEIATLQGENISGHPEYKALKAELREARSEIATWKSDFNNLNRQYQNLLEQIGDDGELKEAEVKDLPDDYTFSGTVTSVSKGSRPDGPSILLVGKFKGTTPPLNMQLVVLDEKNNRICDVKVVRHYHLNDNDDLPVDELGCETVNESPTNPVTKGDRVLWIKDDNEDTSGAAGGE